MLVSSSYFIPSFISFITFLLLQVNFLILFFYIFFFCLVHSFFTIFKPHITFMFPLHLHFSPLPTSHFTHQSRKPDTLFIHTPATINSINNRFLWISYSVFFQSTEAVRSCEKYKLIWIYLSKFVMLVTSYIYYFSSMWSCIQRFFLHLAFLRIYLGFSDSNLEISMQK